MLSWLRARYSLKAKWGCDSVEKGTPGVIINQSVMNDLVDPGSTIEVEISTK